MTLTRRSALAAAAAVALPPALAAAADESSEALASLGVIYALPLVEMYATRRRAEGLGQNGRLLNAPRLADASSRAVTTPNVDTLYSSGWFDLRTGPVTLELPPAGPHYFSLAFMDAWSNNFAVLPGAGPQTPGTATLTGPGTLAGADTAGAVLRSPTRHVWMLARTFAASNDALDEPHRVQAALKVRGAGSPPEPLPEKASLSPEDPVAFFALANRLMGEEGVLPSDGAILAKLRAIGVGPGLSFIDTAATRAGAAAAWARLKTPKPTIVDGWSYPHPDLGNFGTNYEYRAQTALNGLAALPRSEAIYLFGEGDGKGAPGTYDGRRDWTLIFTGAYPGAPAMNHGEPPVEAFWSLTLYERTPEGRQYFFSNAANRFAIASHTPGLIHSEHGALPIFVSSKEPTDRLRRANWLPAPKGPFTLVMRLYKPKEAALNGHWRAPALKAVG